MKKILIFMVLLLVIQPGVFAIEKTKAEKNTPESVGKVEKIGGDSVDRPSSHSAKQGTQVTTPAKRRVDDFIDRNGDGIDDRVAAKKQNPRMKIKPSTPQKPKSNPPSK